MYPLKGAVIVIDILFKKNQKVINNQKERTRCGFFASIYGLLTNLILFAVKIFIGVLSGSVALISDAINSLSDGISAVITLIGFKVSNKPADKEHPFGYARFEYVSALIVAFIICIIGVFLCKTSFDKILNPQQIVVSWLIIIFLIVSILIKISQIFIYKKIGNAIDSDSIKANLVDTRNDTIVSLLTLLAIIIMWVFNINIDAYVGFAVSLFIIFSGFKVFLETLNPLLGEKPDKELVDKITKKLNSYDKILGFHELIIHSYGKNKNYASVHIEVSADSNPLDIHKIVDEIEQDFLKDLKIHFVIHTDPIEDKNEKIRNLKNKVQKVLKQINKQLIVNDFHLIENLKNVHILFDCVVPYEVSITKKEIIKILKESILFEGKSCKFIIDIDREYV